ncbi:hypothetical protein FB45DRAFT_1096998 [Roridomyces roridus]|uniref:MYND-type domain-containing protein n=1 Tax=Roridomyces roridus TaxID=1738132 RepID=A0AAD7BEB5_9AGAR|nr:hypothetical protein FB45DRAFT_1096998 [Roridomyces roridus]
MPFLRPTNLTADTPGIPPNRQLASSDPLAWEERWEQVLEFTAVASRDLPAPFHTERWKVYKETTRLQDPQSRDHIIGGIRSMQKNLCRMQVQMTLNAAPFCVGNELRRRWISASPARRGEIILAGLVSACTSIPEMNEARCCAGKEMSVESHRQNGSLFPDLLEEMMVQNPTLSPADTPNYISHPVWDAIAAEQQSPKTTPCERLALAKILCLRNYLIGFVVYFALCSFLDLPLPELVQTKTGSKPCKPRDKPSQALSMLFGEDSEAVKSFRRVAHQMDEGAYAQTMELNETTTKFPRCKRCWDTMQREVLYCSPECQKVDWKAGHKKECGKWLQLEDLTPSNPEQPSLRIGPPLTGFKRSGALVFQVAQLNHLSPDYDYIIFSIHDRAYLSFQHPPIRAAFRACRDKALTTGDRRAVAMLAQFLRFVCSHDPRPQNIGVGPGGMMEQMSTEFEFPEIARAVDEMEQQMLSDSAQRPPLILDAGVSVEQWKAIPTTWVDVGIIPFTDRASIYGV